MPLPIEQEVGDMLQQRRLTIATAESATGGLIAAYIVNVPGCSAYYMGSVVAYANDVKRDILGVRQSTLDEYGSVSMETAKEMAEGVRRLMKVDVALSDTGIAGPGAGGSDKPVGLFYIGLATPDGTNVQKHEYSGIRQDNRNEAVTAALAMLKAYLDDRK